MADRGARKRARFEKARRLEAKGPASKPGRGSGKPPRAPSARLFIALDLPDRVRADLAAWQREAIADPALRAMPEQALHITLCFLGHHPERAIAPIGDLLEGIEPAPVELTFEAEPAPIPGGRPRLYALGAESEPAKALQRELAVPLEAAGFLEPEKRPFWPHVTVARVRSERVPPEPGERRGRGRPKRVREPPGPLPEAILRSFGAVRIALYRSTLKPEGAEYESLKAIDLPSPAGQKR